MKHLRISMLLLLAVLLASYSANNLSHLFNNAPVTYIVFTGLCIVFALLGVLTAIVASTNTNDALGRSKSLAALACWTLAIPQMGLAISLVVNYRAYVEIITAVKGYSGEAVKILDDGTAILDGDIGYETFLSVIDAHQKEEIPLLKLRSDGGVLSPAISIGEFLKENGIATLVDNYCASVCVLIALYGSPLYVTPNSQFGLHSGRPVASSDSEFGRDIAELGTESLLSKLGELGVPAHLLEITKNTPPEEMHYVSGSELSKIGLAQLITR